MSRPPRPLVDRLTSRLDITSSCWIWIGCVDKGGYGVIKSEDTVTSLKVHRVAYELWVAPIPDGLTVDHLCLNTRCCNPQHLELVTVEENLRRSWKARYRSPTCGRGHEFTPENTGYVLNRGKNWSRYCKRCKNN